MKVYNKHTKMNYLKFTMVLIVLFLFSPESYYAQYEDCTSGSNGVPWNISNLKYYFINGTDDLAGTQEKDAFVDAFNTWAAVTPLTFTETYTKSEAQIMIEFADWTTWCSAMGETSAHGCSYYPNSSCCGVILLNDSTFTFSLSSSSNADLVSVAIHEVGHVLGLDDNTSDSDRVMYWIYAAGRRTLDEGDIADIQNLYPPKEITFKNNFTGGYIYVEDVADSVAAPEHVHS